METLLVQPIMAVNLDALLLDLTGLCDKDMETLALKHYQDMYLDTAQKGIRKAHDGEDIYFFRNVGTGHAFHKTVTGKKDTVDPLRVARVKWIKEFIEGNVSKSEWLCP